MKHLLTTLAVVCIAASAASADTCIRRHRHTDEYYYGGSVTPAEDRNSEIWIEGKKVAFVEERASIIVDLDRQVLVFVNRTDSIYTETGLPLDWASLLAEPDLGRVMMFQITGEVEKTDETKKIDGKKCSRTAFTTWIPYDGGRYNETVIESWMTEDVPFDLETYEAATLHYLAFQNYHEEMLAEAEKFKGVPVRIEFERYIKGFGVKSVETVTGITEEEPPYDVYAPPEGFTKRDKLTLADLRS